jgi:hypothetical protein
MRRRSGIALIGALLLAGGASPSAPQHLPGFLGSTDWTMDDPLFGGLSGLELSADGTTLLALTDRGALVRAQLTRDDAGRITQVDAEAATLLALPPGPLPPDFRFDTEGLVEAGDGTLYVSTEFVTQVIRYDATGGRPHVLPIPPAFPAMPLNGGPEALAMGPDGALYTVPEVTGRPDGAYPVYRYRDGVWDQPYLIAGTAGFLPVGADFGPDGRLYLLERQFRGLGGFASRLRRIDLGRSDEVLFQTPPGAFGNLEGIAVWQAADGALRVTLVSDDNFLSLLGTQLVDFRLPD